MKGIQMGSKLATYDSTHVFYPFLSHKMPRRSSGTDRLANRNAVLALRAAEPELQGTAIGRRLGLNESTVRNILRVYGNHNPNTGYPPTKQGGGRKPSRSKRWRRCISVFFPLQDHKPFAGNSRNWLESTQGGA